MIDEIQLLLLHHYNVLFLLRNTGCYTGLVQVRLQNLIDIGNDEIYSGILG